MVGEMAKRDASGVVFEELEERLWVPPIKQTRDSQNGETSNGDRNGDANLEDDDHGKLYVIIQPIPALKLKTY